MEIPVIIVTFNSASTIQACIESVYTHTVLATPLITVIDNASEDETVSLIQTKFPEITLIVNKQNKGFAAAANQGLITAYTEFVVLLNPDAILENNAIDLCIQSLQQTPSSWCCGALVSNEEFIPRFPGLGKILFEQFFLHKLFPDAYHRFFFYSTQEVKQSTNLFEADYVNGALLCMRSEVLKTHGLLDEDFFLYG